VAYNAGPLLIRAGLITQAQLFAAHKAQGDGGATLVEYLVASGILNEERLCNFYRERLLVPRVASHQMTQIPARVIARLPADMATEFRVIPFEVDREQNLILAMADPSDTHAVDEIGFFTGSYVLRAVAAPSSIARALVQYYGISVGPLAEAIPVVVAKAPAPTAPAAPAVPVVSRAHALPVAMGLTMPMAVDARAMIASSTIVVDTHAPPPTDAPFASPKLPHATPMARPEEPAPSIIVDPSLTAPDLPAAELPSVIVEAIAMPEHSPFAEAVAQSVHLDRVPEAAPSPPVAEAPESPEAPQPVEEPIVLPMASSEAAHVALEAALKALEAVADRDAIAEVLVTYLSQLCRRAAFFVVKKGTLCGWQGSGQGVHTEQVRKAALALDAPSIFRDIVHTRLPYRGPVADPLSRDFVIDSLGWAPPDMLAIPVTVRGKVVSILYGDERLHAVPDDHLVQVARSAGEALERAVAVKKHS
jgi:hypothetical protein